MMPFRLCCCSLTACFVLVAPSIAIYGQGLQVPAQISPTASESGVVNEAGVVLQELARGTERIPERLLAEAAGIAIIPHYMRGAFVVGVSGGRGVLLARDQTGRWLAPEFITMGGGSVGWQIGVQATDLVNTGCGRFGGCWAHGTLRKRRDRRTHASRNFDLFAQSWIVCGHLIKRLIIAIGRASHTGLLSNGA